MSSKFIVVYDTYCGWCYGAHPVFEALVASGADVQTYHRHLFQGPNAHKMADGFGAQAEQYDMRIGQMSGQPFSQDYVQNILRSPTEVLASGLTAQAACLIHAQGAQAELALAARLQKARYVEGVSAADTASVVTALVAAGLPQAEADRLGTAELLAQTADIASQAATWLDRVGARGVPALIKVQGDQLTPVDVGALMGDPSQVLALV